MQNLIFGVYTKKSKLPGPSIVCTSNATFSLHNFPPGSSVTWQAYNVSPTSGADTIATFHSICSNIGETEVVFTIKNAVDTFQVSKTFLSGGPDPQDVELDVYTSSGQHARQSGGTWLLCPNTTYHIYCVNSSSCSTSNYTWILPSSLTKNYQYNNMVSVTTNANPGGNIIVKAQTCCTGCGSNVQILSDYVGRDYSCGGYYMSFTPNPANEEVTVELNTDNLAEYREGAPWTLEIYTSQQVLQKKYTGITETKKVIRTGSFKPGIYYVRAVVGGRSYAGKFVIER